MQKPNNRYEQEHLRRVKLANPNRIVYCNALDNSRESGWVKCVMSDLVIFDFSTLVYRLNLPKYALDLDE